MMKKEFLDFNGQKKVENTLKQSIDMSQRKQEHFYYFPFTYGEEVEKYREGLRVQLKGDL